MPDRDRAKGWKHAKLSGHANEDKIESLLQSDITFQSTFLDRIGKHGRSIISIAGGGLGESHVPSVFRNGDLTTPKADMYVTLDNGDRLTFSIKKSLAGQVYLVTIENFIEAFEQHFEPIPDIVKRGIELYWGSACDTQEIINRFGTQKRYENRKHRVVAESIRDFDRNIYTSLLNWFISQSGKIAELCFARGGAKLSRDWAQYVWYKNELGETSVDAIFKIADVCESVAAQANQSTFFGNRNGGSTIQLPFGFVQWHSPQNTIPGSLQFHHKYNSVAAIVPNEKMY